jgi:hypothetical protein
VRRNRGAPIWNREPDRVWFSIGRETNAKPGSQKCDRWRASYRSSEAICFRHSVTERLPRLARLNEAWLLVCGCSLRTQQGAIYASANCFLTSWPLFWWLGIPLAAIFWGWFLPGLLFDKVFVGEFDPGSGRTLAACLTHASRATACFRVCMERRTGE